MDTTEPLTVLFLCTGNSARSILAEALLNARGGSKLRGLSAGSQPAGRVHPQALAKLAAAGIDTAGLRSKSWDEFSAGPPIDIVITVCDSAAGESCPAFPGRALRVHWGIPDPAAAAPADVAADFERAYDAFDRRIDRLLRIPFVELDDPARRGALVDIARAEPWRADPDDVTHNSGH